MVEMNESETDGNGDFARRTSVEIGSQKHSVKLILEVESRKKLVLN